MNSLQKRAIARLAFKEIRAVIDKWESLGNYGTIPVDCGWNGDICVEGKLFKDWELRESDET